MRRFSSSLERWSRFSERSRRSSSDTARTDCVSTLPGPGRPIISSATSAARRSSNHEPETMSDDDEIDTEQLVLGDLLNHVLDKGVVIGGSVTISVADIDLLMLDLRLLLTSIETSMRRGIDHTVLELTRGEGGEGA